MKSKIEEQITTLYCKQLEISKELEKKVEEYVKNFKEGDTISSDKIVIDRIQFEECSLVNKELYKVHLRDVGWIYLEPPSLVSYIIS